MQNFYKLLIILFLFPALTFAQSNYRPGYIINLKGDTVKGFIDVRTWSNSPRSVNFKAGAVTSRTQTFGVSDIRGFSSSSLTFKSFYTKVSTDRTGYGDLSVGRDTSYRMDTIFMQVVQQGKNITLYSYTDPIKTRFYIVENINNQPGELIYRVYTLPDHSIIQSSQNVYMGQLYKLAQKYNVATESLKETIEGSRYDIGDLENICLKINDNRIVDTKIAGEHSKINLFIGGGVQMSTITPSGTFPVYNLQPSKSSSPAFDLGFNVFPNAHYRALVLKLEVAYLSNSYSSEANAYINDSKHSTYAFKQNIIAIIPQIQYNVFNAENFKIFLNIGLSINRSTYTGNSFTNESSGEYTSDFLAYNGTWFSIPARIGVTLFKHLDLYAAYSFSQSITDNTSSTSKFGDGIYDYSMNVSSLRIGLNYNFSL